MLVSAVATGTVLVLLSQVRALWHLYTLYSLFGVAGAGLGVVAVGAVVAKWFRRKRGIAAGVAVIGIGLGAIVMIPLAGWLISTVGWRLTYVVLGVLTWVTLVPAVALIVRSEPGELGLQPDGDAAIASGDPADGNANAADPCVGGQRWTLPAAMCTSAFWLIAGSMFLCSIGVFGVLTHHRWPFSRTCSFPS
jgi:MFS family permease